MRKPSIIITLLLTPLLLSVFGQGCTRALEFSSITDASVHFEAASGNGEPYDGKLRILHHYVDHFTCEGRPQPESILIRENETDWYLIRNTLEKCAFIDRLPVQGVQYDEPTNRATYNAELYVPPHPYFVIASEDPNLSDVRPEDGVCEDINGLCSLKASIDQAGITSMTEAVLVHIPEGTYSVTKPIVLTTQFSEGKAITIRGAGPVTTILDGNDLVIPLRIDVANLAPVSVENIAIQNGNGFISNVGFWVPGIFSTRGSDMRLNITNCLFKNNKGNTVISGGNGSHIRIGQSQFLSNQMPTAINTMGMASLLIEDTAILNGTGFGVWTRESNNVTIRRSTFAQNLRQGISFDDCHSCLLENVTISRNEQTGIVIFASTFDPSYDVTIKNSTFIENGTRIIQTQAGNLQAEFSDSRNKLFLNNSILAMNNASKVNCAFGNTSSHRIIATNSLFDDSSCEQLGSGNILANPQLGPLGDNGGFAPTMLPLIGSPAIDAGANLVCSKEDQRGLARPIDKLGAGARCDIGAIELQ